MACDQRDRAIASRAFPDLAGAVVLVARNPEHSLTIRGVWDLRHQCINFFIR
jgi:hypothetical protein